MMLAIDFRRSLGTASLCTHTKAPQDAETQRAAIHLSSHARRALRRRLLCALRFALFGTLPGAARPSSMSPADTAV